MWIWVLADSDGGNLAAITATATHLGIRTLMVKSSDGTTVWPQFNPLLAQILHAAHLRVCAWQYVYGVHPIIEAEAGAAAVRAGADCLVIDAEVEYQGLYVQAQRYLTKLRSLIGPQFPLALAGFPWIDYHPSFPYSVFLGPDGAQYNVPQMYWWDIGTSVRKVYSHTYTYNEVYQRPIDPLGQLFGSPPASDILRFRALSRAYGARGVSWWDWQSATPAGLIHMSQPVGNLTGFTPATTVATLSQGSVGDVVVWAQEHLLAAGYPVTINGDYAGPMQAAVAQFQSAHALPVTGVIDPYTWAALLKYPAPAIRWTSKHRRLSALVAAARATRGVPDVLPVPWSASLPQRSDELARAGGAGRSR
jgi:hypothetical protein